MLRYKVLPNLLNSANRTIILFARRDLLDESLHPVEKLYDLSEVKKIISKQLPDGSWKYPGKMQEVFPHYHYFLMETWKRFRLLVQQYQFTKEFEPVAKAAEFLFSCQNEEGDIRGMIGNQYTTYYTGAILGLLINAGFEDENRTEKGLRWLINNRQKDGGWCMPLSSSDMPWKEQMRLSVENAEPIPFDFDAPSCHNCTGMAIRAFAAHSQYQFSSVALEASNLLKSRFFKRNAYSTYQNSSYWTKFQFPYWWNHLLAALDSISLISTAKEDKPILDAINWFIENQEQDGLWRLDGGRKGKPNPESPKTYEMKLWIALTICKVLKRFGIIKL